MTNQCKQKICCNHTSNSTNATNAGEDDLDVLAVRAILPMKTKREFDLLNERLGKSANMREKIVSIVSKQNRVGNSASAIDQLLSTENCKTYYCLFFFF